MVHNTDKSSMFDNISSFIKGGISGFMGALITQPIDVVKNNIQYNNSIKHVSLMPTIRGIYTKFGVMGFYRGFAPQMLAFVPEKALIMGVYDNATHTLIKNNVDEDMAHLYGGAIAGGSQIIMSNPTGFFKIQRQLNGLTMRDCFRTVPWRSFYSGSTWCFIRDIKFNGLFFYLQHKLSSKTDTTFDKFWKGAISAIPAAIIATPTDTIRTFAIMKYPNHTTVKDIKELYNKHGLKYFMSGGILRMVRIPIYMGSFLAVYNLLGTSFSLTSKL
jgi:hypothetical protein